MAIDRGEPVAVALTFRRSYDSWVAGRPRDVRMALELGRRNEPEDKRMKRLSMSTKTRFEVFHRDWFTCQYCGRQAPDAVLEVDHRTPHSAGGTDHPDNLLTACWDCNSGKSDRDMVAQMPPEWIQNRRRILEDLVGEMIQAAKQPGAIRAVRGKLWSTLGWLLTIPPTIRAAMLEPEETL